MNATDRNADDPSVGQLAEQAASAIRALNHLTRPAVAELTDPLDAAEVIGSLAQLASMLPQLLDQLARWLQREQHADRLRVDADAPAPDPAQAVHAAAGALRHAADCARRAGHALDIAHQHTAYLAADLRTDRWQR